MAPLLSQNSSGPDVRQAQQKLNQAGASVLPRLVEDSVFGAKTRGRLIEFQRSRGLAPDGVVGPKTRTALGMSAVAPVGPVPPAGAASNPALVNVVVSATRAAFDAWRVTASFAGISIIGVAATGGPGCLKGPGLFPFITSKLVGVALADSATAMAAARGIADKFQQWQTGVTVPGLPWYPTFATFPGPFAPPTPNVPTPLVALRSAGLPGMTTPALLQAAMSAAMGGAAQGPSTPVFRDIALQVAVLFQTSILSAMVKNVMGSGPVATFAPPVVPVGPVVGGTASSSPGALA